MTNFLKNPDGSFNKFKLGGLLLAIVIFALFVVFVVLYSIEKNEKEKTKEVAEVATAAADKAISDLEAVANGSAPLPPVPASPAPLPPAPSLPVTNSQPNLSDQINMAASQNSAQSFTFYKHFDTEYKVVPVLNPNGTPKMIQEKDSSGKLLVNPDGTPKMVQETKEVYNPVFNGRVRVPGRVTLNECYTKVIAEKNNPAVPLNKKPTYMNFFSTDTKGKGVCGYVSESEFKTRYEPTLKAIENYNPPNNKTHTDSVLKYTYPAVNKSVMTFYKVN